jgi:hypothetical protein
MGHSLQIVGRRKSLHVRNAPKADSKSQPWQPVTKGNRREPSSSDDMPFARSRSGGTISKKSLCFYVYKTVPLCYRGISRGEVRDKLTRSGRRVVVQRRRM